MKATRRQALGFFGAGLGASLLAACSSSNEAATPAPQAGAAQPTTAPTAEPTAAPTKAAVAAPTAAPTKAATAAPTAAPTKAPVAAPKAEPTPAQSILAAKSGKPTIDIWHAYGSGVGRNVILSMVKKFNETSGIGVNESFNASSWDVRVIQKFYAASAAHTPPDVYNIGSGPLEWAGRGVLLSLDDYMSRDKVSLTDKEYYPFPAFTARFEGKVYGLPYDTDSRGLFWNKKHFDEADLDPEKPPKTWSELLATAKKLLQKKGDRIERIGFSPLYGQSFIWSWGGSAGGAPFLDWNQQPPKARLNTPEMIKALEFMLELTDLNGGATQLNAFQKGFQGGVSEPFLTGQVSSLYHGSWYPETIKQYKPDWEYGKDYGIAAEPIADAGGKLFTYTGGWNITIPTDAKHKDEAWEFIHWFTDDPQMLWWDRDTGHIPPKRSVAADPAFNVMPTKFFIDAMNYAGGRAMGPWTEEPKYSTSSAQDDVLYKKRTAKDALTQANEEYQKIVDNYYKNNQ